MRTRLLLTLALAGCITGNIDGDEGGGGGGGGSGSGSSVGGTPHEACVSETNRLRAMGGKPAIARSSQLESYADQGAMVDFGSSPHQHFSQTQGGGIAFAENECPRWSLANQGGGDMNQLVVACLAAFYGEGPGGGHYDNLMGNFAKLGCGIYENSGTVTVIQDFGN